VLLLKFYGFYTRLPPGLFKMEEIIDIQLRRGTSKAASMFTSIEQDRSLNLV
jgi:hypothetical protein